VLFNSLDFAVFLPLVFVLYWFVFNNKLRLQNALVVVASYVFYGWWDWRFLSLIFISSIVDFFVALRISKTVHERNRTLLLCVSLILNLGLLGFFKYYNFFADSIESAFSFLGHPVKFHPMSIVLPVGISFYTFQLLSYTIDVYRRKLEPARDFIAFLTFVSFFPQLVAGPIERAAHLLPQFYVKREFNYSRAVDGMRQILWGLFKKIVIADNCATYVDWAFGPSDPSGSTVALGAILFAFQIYGDFSGYSDIAIGTARLFGIELMRNFSYPYFSTNIAEFWRRWHISLTSWFRDYVYIPLGGNRGTLGMKIRNIFIVFILSGFWHGANWTFVIWGLLHAVYYTPLLLSERYKTFATPAENIKAVRLNEVVGIVLTFSLTTFAWIFFRSDSVNDAFDYISRLFSKSVFEMPADIPYVTLLFLIFFLWMEWQGRNDEYALERVGFNWPRFARLGLYYTLLAIIVVFGGTTKEFIYFQF
jgi:D-alanyl-lipoteichoic acid acyltransferase DltB (MBOAT superfamily)